MYRIIQKQDGTYRCEVEIQDGTERWSETDLEMAKDAVKSTMKVMNGTKIKKKSIPIYREMPVSEVKLVRLNPPKPSELKAKGLCTYEGCNNRGWPYCFHHDAP